MNDNILLEIVGQKIDTKDMEFEEALKKGMKQFGFWFFAMQIIAITDDFCEEGKITEDEAMKIINHVECLEKKFLKESNDKFMMKTYMDSIFKYANTLTTDEKLIYRSEHFSLIINFYSEGIVISLTSMNYSDLNFKQEIAYLLDRTVKSITVKQITDDKIIVKHDGEISDDIINYFERKMLLFFKNYNSDIDKNQLMNDLKLTQNLIKNFTNQAINMQSKLQEIEEGRFKPIWYIS